MAYLGRSVDAISNIETLDNITFDGSSSYTLQKGGSNFVPSSANAILISIDGVVNAGNFTVSSSTIDFGVAVSSSSVCNFIIHLGVGLITSPSDGSVNTDQLAATAVTPAKMDLSQDYTFTGKVSGHMFPAFDVFLSTEQTGISNNATNLVKFNSKKYDTDNAFDTTDGQNRFTVPSGKAGKYFFYCGVLANPNADNQTQEAIAYIYKNGSSYRFVRARYNTSHRARYAPLTISTAIDLVAGDYIQVYFLGDDTNSAHKLEEDVTFFGGYRIGD